MSTSLAEAQPAYLAQVPPHRMKSRSERIGIVGLGYVGLPISLALADVFETVIGYDINKDRIEALQDSHDWTNEVDENSLLASTLSVTSRPDDLAGCSIYVVAVPTPVNDANRPDLAPLKQTCQMLAPYLNVGDVVIFESTVYPGATEEVCATELELYSGYKSGTHFHVAYSPERITPGDQTHGLEDVTKIVAADNRAVLERIAKIYERIVPAGVHRAPSIKVAEAAKVFENTQRDVNIALMNEFALICDKLSIRTRDVISATGTKWNALPFTPGLVGGHCIGVDPHYLTSKAEEAGIYPEIMLASRRRNEAMAEELSAKVIKLLAKDGIPPNEARVGILGVTFKEDVPDMRNSKVVDIVRSLEEFGVTPLIHDPHADRNAIGNLQITLADLKELSNLDVLLLAVPHKEFLGDDGHFIQKLVRWGGTLMDVKSCLEPTYLRSDVNYWSL